MLQHTADHESQAMWLVFTSCSSRSGIVDSSALAWPCVDATFTAGGSCKNQVLVLLPAKAARLQLDGILGHARDVGHELVPVLVLHVRCTEDGSVPCRKLHVSGSAPHA